MSKRNKTWYEKKWLAPTVAILTLVSAPFLEDIRKAVLAGVGVMSVDWFFDFVLTGGMIGLALLLIVKSERATRACEDLGQKLTDDLANQRDHFSTALSDSRRRHQEELSTLVDAKLKPISDDIRTLQSYANSLGSRLDALNSRITALNDTVERLTKRD